jgi:dynein light intermediate chain 1
MLDILARMSIHLLSDARTPYAPLLDCTFTSNTISHTLAVILLDWDEPWLWLRQFRERIFMLKSVLDVLDNNSKDKMDNSMKLWRERRIGPAVEGTTSMTTFQSDKSQQPPPPPLGPGEWDEPLGIPLCIVCHRAENVHILAREHAWNDTHFDHILQHLRTIVLKHGGSLVYTSSTDSGSDITDLVRSSLDIHSLLKKTIIKPEAIARDKILIPPNWDTWGKIKTLDADFDAEGVSKAWSAELDQSLTNTTTSEATATISPCQNELFGAYEQKIQGPNRTLANTNRLETPAAESKPRPDLQAFLASQVPVLKRLEAEDAEERRQVQEAQAALQPSAAQRAASGSMRPGDTTGGAVPYIGPVSINVGGVTIDVDEAVRGLQSQIEARKEEQKAKEVHAEPEDEHKKRLEWFAGLASRKKSIGGSPATPSTPAPYRGQ